MSATFHARNKLKICITDENTKFFSKHCIKTYNLSKIFCSLF